MNVLITSTLGKKCLKRTSNLDSKLARRPIIGKVNKVKK